MKKSTEKEFNKIKSMATKIITKDGRVIIYIPKKKAKEW